MKKIVKIGTKVAELLIAAVAGVGFVGWAMGYTFAYDEMAASDQTTEETDSQEKEENS